MAKKNLTQKGIELSGTIMNLVTNERLVYIDRQGRIRSFFRPRGYELPCVVTPRNFTTLKSERDQAMRRQALYEELPYVTGATESLGYFNGTMRLVRPEKGSTWPAELAELWQHNIDQLDAEIYGLDDMTAEPAGAMREYAVVSRGVAMVAVLKKLNYAERLLVPAEVSVRDGKLYGYSALLPAKYLRQDA